MDSSSESNNDDDSDYHDSEDDDNSSSKNITYDIVLSWKAWEKIKPIKVLYRDNREYEKMNHITRWTDYLAEKMWRAKKARCCYKFIKDHIYKRKGKPYLYFYGNCVVCGAKFSGTCKNRPSETDSSVTINIKTTDTSKIPHPSNRKRFLAGERRKVAKESLQYMKPKHYKIKEACRLMDDSDPIPALLSNSLVYAKLKQEAVDEKLRLENYPGRPLESLHAIMDDRPEIKMISTNPFIVMYWTEKQIKFWNEVSRLPEVVTSIDASGNFVKKINIIDENYSSDIFLYVIVVNFSGKIFPVAQMLSDSHNTNTISDFLSRVKEDGGPTPDNIVSDCSLALLNSISSSYNGCSYNQYLANCFDILQQRKSILPACLVKRDRNHLLKNVTKWKCFDSSQDGVKDFFTRCIAYLLEVETFELLEEVIMSILIVAQSKNCDENSECDKRKKYLINKIETFDYNNLFVESEYGVNQYHKIQLIEVEDIDEMPNKIVGWLHELNQKCKAMCSNDSAGFPNPNFLECEPMIKNIMMLFSQFPAWTNVMHIYYPTAKVQSSSTCSECYNMIMKTVYDMSHARSANRFILNHLNFIVPEIRIGRGMLKNVPETEDQVTDSITKLESINIRGRKNSKNGNCDSINDMIIMNGLKLPPVCIRNHKYQLINTCPFDSIAELFIEAYDTIPYFKHILNKFLIHNKNNFLELIKDHAWSESLLQILYTRRAEIMLQFCESQQSLMNCEMNVTSLFEKLTKGFSDILGLVSCDKCNTSRTLRYQSKIVQKLSIEDSKTCKDFLLSIFSEDYIKCRNCSNSKAILKYKLGSCIAFDVEHVFETAAESSPIDSMPNITNLSKYLPLNLEYEKDSYKLLGLISFQPVQSKTGSHYVAYLRKSGFWEERNDIRASARRISIENLQCFVAVIIYVKSWN